MSDKDNGGRLFACVYIDINQQTKTQDFPSVPYYSEEVLYCYAHMSHQRLSSHYHFLDGVSAKIVIILWGIEALRVIEGQ